MQNTSAEFQQAQNDHAVKMIMALGRQREELVTIVEAAVQRYTETGELDDIVRLPATLRAIIATLELL